MRSIFKSTLVALTLLTASVAHAGFEGCPQFFAKGKAPQLGQSLGWQKELCFDNFAVLHSGQSKTPIFVAERLNRASLEDAKGEERTDKFYEEARLPGDHRARLADYARSGFDRGHMAPAADMTNPKSMAQSFSLANMVPQAPENNRKSWAGIEKATRKYASRASGDVFVITGPVYSGDIQTIGPGQVWIPKYLYKLVYDVSDGRAWAHWIENTDEARAGRPISYAELVKRTGIDFFPGQTPKD